MWAGFALVLVLLLRLLPGTPLEQVAPSSRSVMATGGELLRLTLAADDQYRLWTPLSEVSHQMQEAVLLYEDRWFFWHPGVNPWALFRAALTTASGERRMGGSTITMQLARRIYRVDSRSVRGKIWQSLLALWLELRFSKHEILEAYLNLAPFGGNIEGVGAASLIYLSKPASQLSVADAINFAVIPQNPRKRLGEGGEASPELHLARKRLAYLWQTRHPEDRGRLEDALLHVPFKPRSALPFRAPHLADYLLRQRPERVIQSTLDSKVQGVLERVLREYVRSKEEIGISNAAALLVDTSSLQVKAMVGSANYFNDQIAGQVNGVFGKRSPGSTLKPFIYGLALDQGLIHSGSILKDGPSSYGAFSPENFDGRFAGPLSAQEALIRSRNIPAVDLASRLARPNLYDLLKLGGVRKLAAESHYGLALVLGGGEVTMEELAQLYAMLANEGRWQALRYLAGEKSPPGGGISLLSPSAAFITLDMLRQTPRPDTYGPARPAVAWKTGTSWGFRDAWTAGVFGPYVLVVWVGNFDGMSNPAFIGIEAAAPLFLRIVDALRAERLDPGSPAITQPGDLQKVEICTASGELPNEYCLRRSQAWFIAGKSPAKTSTLHRAIWIDQRNGKLACGPGPHVRQEIIEFWPSDMQAIFRQAGMPLRQPPSGDCGNEALPDMDAPHIVSPLRGVVHLQRLGRQEPIYLRAEAGPKAGTLHWFADDALVGSSQPGEVLAWQPPQVANYTIRVVDQRGRGDSREVRLQLTE